MALSPPVIYGALAANRASGIFAMSGINFDSLAWGIANGICQWGISQPQNLGLTGFASGTIGAGVINPITTKIIVAPNIGIMSAALTGAGVSGQLGQTLAMVVANGISQAFSTAGQYLGTAAGVGVGADVSQITIVNSGTLLGILTQSLLATLGPGSALSLMVNGLTTGISSLLLTGTGVGSVNGPPLPAPASGPTVSVVV